MKEYCVIIGIILNCITVFGQFPEQKLIPSDNKSGDFFGRYLSIQNNSLLISAHEDDANGYASGSLYIYQFDNSDQLFSEKQNIYPEDGDVEEFFGYSVDMDGTWAVTGSHHDSDFGGSSGSAFVLAKQDETWEIYQKLWPEDPVAGDEFGKAVSLSKNEIAIGAFLDDDRFTNSGSVYIFRKDDVWQQVEELYASDAAAYDQFGNFLSLKDEWLVVGVPEKSIKGEKSGAAYLYKKTGDNYEETQQIIPDDLLPGDQFGQAVALDGTTLAIGAYKADNPLEDGGKIYVYKLYGNTWEFIQTLIPADNETGDHFGSSVALQGDLLVAGAYFDDDKGSKSGSAYLYHWENGQFEFMTKLSASDGKEGAAFGAAVGIDATNLVIGAYADSENGFFSGAAYVYDISSVVSARQPDPKNAQITVFPVITDQKITITVPENMISEDAELIILDQNGNKCAVLKQTGKVTELDLSRLRKGLYFLQFNSPYRSITKRFIRL